MPAKTSPTKERRHSLRSLWPAEVAINLIEPPGLVPIDHVNLSEGGLCVRLPATLEVRSMVRFQLTAGQLGRRPMECTGRVAWVTQRLDLRNIPPYLFDVGIEFVDPPRFLARLTSNAETAAESQPGSARLRKLACLEAHGRRFVPRIVRDAAKPAAWHLVVSVDGAPCLSQHFATEQAAYNAWLRFQRWQARNQRASR